jgi:DNA polymerase-3 subunit alpha
MLEQREKFMNGSKEKKINPKIAGKVFDDICKFAEYAFNKSHSTGYALVAYQTAFLKAHYPEEFMAATLTSEMDDLDRIMVLVDECKRMGIKLLPPDVNESNAEFTVVAKGVRFGLRAVKNVGQGAIDSIVAARQQYGRFRNIYDFCEQVDLGAVNKRVVESLILAGALDSLEGKRWQHMAVLDAAMDQAQTVQSDRRKGQTSLFDQPDGKKDQAARKVQLPEAAEWPLSEMLKHEKELLGFYVSGHPLERYEEDLKAFATHSMADISNVDDGRDVRVGGIVLIVNEKLDRNGKPYAFFSMEDFSGSGEALIFSEPYEKYREHIVKDGLVFLYGKASTKEKGNGKVIVNEVVPLPQVRRKMAKYLLIGISTPGLETPLLENVKTMLGQHPGKCPVLLEVNSPNHQKVRLRSQFAVSLTDRLITELKELVGKESVKIG